MSKDLSFDRPNNYLYLQKFCNNTGASDWPPQPEAEGYTHNRLIDLIGKEIKDVIKPQLEKNKTSIPSHIILTTILSKIVQEAGFERNPAEHFNIVSNKVFEALEKEIPVMLGQSDFSDWGWVNENV